MLKRCKTSEKLNSMEGKLTIVSMNKPCNIKEQHRPLKINDKKWRWNIEKRNDKRQKWEVLRKCWSKHKCIQYRQNA